MNFFRPFQKVLCFGALCLSFAHADFFDMNGLRNLRYGPNLSLAISGNTPFVWGQWLNQNFNTLSFNWIEPLRDLPYGEILDPEAAFLRFSADIEATPFYGGFRVGIGARPFKINPQVEARYIYENYTYFDSDVEMTLASGQENGDIADTWTADWITDRIYSDDAAVNFMQNFAFYFDMEYSFGSGGLLGLGIHYTLIDISSEYEGKSYDYRRNIPVFSRDYIIDLIAYANIPLTEHFSLNGYLNQYNTGAAKSYSGSYLKEPLSYTITLVGPSFAWDDRDNRLTLLGGFWMREKKHFYSGDLSQQFLVHLQYERNFRFLF